MRTIYKSNLLRTRIFLLVFAALLASCKPEAPTPPYKYESKPQFTWGFAEFYGDYYNHGVQPIENNVVTLNLFTEKLFLNDKNQLDGVGQYLIIEDIFNAPTDTLLPDGNYNVAETAEPFTFFGGKKFEDNREAIPSGAYIYYIESDPTKSKNAYITDGAMTINAINDTTYSVSCNFILDEKTELKGTFNGVLYHLDRTAATPAASSKKRMELVRKIKP